VHIRTLSLVELPMLRSLLSLALSQTNQKAAPADHSAKCIDPSLLKLVAGGAPKGGWLEPELQLASSQAPKGGWC
jgi:hypothetical protein